MEIVVLRWIVVGFFTLVGVMSLLAIVGVPKSIDPPFRKWAVATFCGSILTNGIWLFRQQPLSLIVPLVPPAGMTLGPDLIAGEYTYLGSRPKSGPIEVALGPGGYQATLEPEALGKAVTLRFHDGEGKAWLVEPFFPKYNRQQLVAEVPGPHGSLLDAGPELLPGSLALAGVTPALNGDARATAGIRFDNYARKLEGRRGKTRYAWRVFVNEPPRVLDTIAEVEYLLHPTFPEPYRSSWDRARQSRSSVRAGASSQSRSRSTSMTARRPPRAIAST